MPMFDYIIIWNFAVDLLSVRTKLPPAVSSEWLSPGLSSHGVPTVQTTQPMVTTHKDSRNLGRGGPIPRCQSPAELSPALPLSLPQWPVTVDEP